MVPIARRAARADVARKIAITSFGIGAVAGVAVVGIVLMIVAIIGLLPIDPQAALISILVLGAVMTSVAGFLAYKGFAEKKWLEMSKSYELMDAALGKWDNSLVPPDPREVMKKSAKAADASEARADSSLLATR